MKKIVWIFLFFLLTLFVGCGLMLGVVAKQVVDYSVEHSE